MNLTRTKTIEQSIADTEEPDHQLRKELGPLQLTVFGVGVIIGTGIFVLTGEAAGEKAGPAVALSFLFSGIACALAAAGRPSLAPRCPHEVNVTMPFRRLARKGGPRKIGRNQV